MLLAVLHTRKNHDIVYKNIKSSSICARRVRRKVERLFAAVAFAFYGNLTFKMRRKPNGADVKSVRISQFFFFFRIFVLLTHVEVSVLFQSLHETIR